jgi:hypothetical protein
MPPGSWYVEKSAQFADAVRKLAAELHVPLSDYHSAILQAPAGTIGTARCPKFKEAGGDVYQVPTLISRMEFIPSNPKAFVGGLLRGGAADEWVRPGGTM